VTLERCVDAFLAHSEAQGRSPNTLRTYRQIADELKSRWQGWRIVDVDVDFDELEDYRDELAERGLAGSTLNQRRAALSGVFELATATSASTSTRWTASSALRLPTPATLTSTASRRSGRSCVPPPPAPTTPASAPTRVPAAAAGR
jgi:site-specific recombinase XerD